MRNSWFLDIWGSKFETLRLICVFFEVGFWGKMDIYMVYSAKECT